MNILEPVHCRKLDVDVETLEPKKLAFRVNVQYCRWIEISREIGFVTLFDSVALTKVP